MTKPSWWTAEKRYQIEKEALSQKEPVGQIARRHQVSEGLIYRVAEGLTVKRAMRLFGIIAKQLLPPSSRDERLSRVGDKHPRRSTERYWGRWRSSEWKRDIVEFVPKRWRGGR
jgi:hypothetical protein